MTKQFISKQTAAKELCIHCKHIRKPMGDTKYCDFFRSKVDDSAIWRAERARNDKDLCGGKYWKLSPDITVVESQAEADFLIQELQIEEYASLATDIVLGKRNTVMTNGLLNIAIERAKQKQPVAEQNKKTNFFSKFLCKNKN